jgi:deoxyguanosine kinase
VKRHFFLAIEGVIGVGKTTLARLLQPRFAAELQMEAFEENPFLSDFYADRARYAFQTQMFFLLSRYRQQQSLPSLLGRGPLIADYTFGKDSLFAHMNLSGDELDVYNQLYGVLADRIPLPDLVVYLRAETDVLMMRIAMRDRAYEREMDRAYIEGLRQAYERYFAAYTRTPLLILDVDELDYVRDQRALAFIEGKVRMALGIGVYQRPLPQMDQTGVAQAPTGSPPSGDAVPVMPGWAMLRDFLVANEAMGRVGTMLADRSSERALASGEGWPTGARAELEVALEETIVRLQQIAHTAGVDRRGSEPRDVEK